MDAPATPTLPGDPAVLRQTVRPLTLGLSVGHASGGAGTLGAFVSKDDRVYLLSANEVLAPTGREKPGDWIHQPANADVIGLTARTRIATLSDFAELSTKSLNKMNGAIALVDEDVPSAGNRIPGGLACPLEGKLVRSVTEAKPSLSMREVGKIGRTTGYTTGKINAFLSLVTIFGSGGVYAFADLIEVVSEGIPFSRPGDGGALVFTLEPLRALGILVAAGESKPDQQWFHSYVCPLQPVLDAFGVTLWQGRSGPEAVKGDMGHSRY